MKRKHEDGIKEKNIGIEALMHKNNPDHGQIQKTMDVVNKFPVKFVSHTPPMGEWQVCR